MDDIVIIDDLLPKQHQDFITWYFMRGDTEWYFQKDITFDDGQESEKRVNHYGFAKLIFDRQNKPDSVHPDFFNILPIVYRALEHIDDEVETMLRMRAFLQFPVRGSDDDRVNNPHVDLPIGHTVVLYYLTDTDGDTIIYNETEKSDNYTIKKTIKPKKGRCVIFNGKHYHSSSRPTNGVRTILNVDLITKESVGRL